MDAETRHTLAATAPSTLVRVSFVFLALCEHDRENGASAQKTNEKNQERERTRGRGEGRRRKRRRKEIKSLPMLSMSIKRNIRKSGGSQSSLSYRVM